MQSLLDVSGSVQFQLCFKKLLLVQPKFLDFALIDCILRNLHFVIVMLKLPYVSRAGVPRNSHRICQWNETGGLAWELAAQLCSVQCTTSSCTCVIVIYSQNSSLERKSLLGRCFVFMHQSCWSHQSKEKGFGITARGPFGAVYSGCVCGAK